jgi:dihydropteroate synthase
VDAAEGVLRLGERTFGPGQLLVMTAVSPAAGLERVHAAVAEGADILAVAEIGFVAAVRDAYPDLVIAAEASAPEAGREACAAGADLLGAPQAGVAAVAAVTAVAAVAAEFGAGVLGTLAEAATAVAAGVSPERIIVDAGPRPRPALLADLAATGWPVLVSPGDRDLARALAAAAVSAWLGARVFRVGRVRETRRALRMVSAIRGDLPPASAVRGLA